jgi:deoxyribodipyrimidine photo-lyase
MSRDMPALSRPVLLWFRRDLRLADNPALLAAVESEAPIVPVYVWSPDDDGAWAPGAASRAYLAQSLGAIERALRGRGSRLVVRQGRSEQVLPRLASELQATAVFANQRHEPSAAAVDARVARRLADLGIAFLQSEGALLVTPSSVHTRTGGPFQVFTPFWRACLAQLCVTSPRPAPPAWRSPAQWPESLRIGDLPLAPEHPWSERMLSHWTAGEAGAEERLRRFCAGGLASYATGRDLPGVDGVSRLSAHLHAGELGPRQIWYAVTDWQNLGAHGIAAAGETFLRELGWREFSHHVLHHFPTTDTEPLRPAFKRFPWSRSRQHLRAWQRGLTGYPLVDAGMRELWATGFMHNRVRMVVASFLVKHLLQPWQEGARWFWDTLVDADLAQNSLNWQWSAGCGADAAPYFRIFNPTTQAQRYDPDGAYIRLWVPELARLPLRLVFEPWTAPAAELRAAGVVIGETYPAPIVDHAAARERALAALASVRGR